jgi:DNA recombination protein RmuC
LAGAGLGNQAMTEYMLPAALSLGFLLGVSITAAAMALRHQRREQSARLAHAAELSALREENGRLQERLEADSRAASEKLELLQNARKQLEEEFSNLANRIFEEKSQRFLKTNQDSLRVTLDPLKSQLKEFRSRVDYVYDKESRDRMSLLHELNSLKQLNMRMSEDAVNLTRALKGDKKAQGNWGEIVLERVLEESGLRKGHEYETQLSAISSSGQRRQPDVVVHLPDKRDIIIDSKVSLVAYERYVSSEEEAERKQALAEHVGAIKQHIDGLSLKQYEQLEGINSLDFVLLFIPIESAFMAAFDSDPTMFSQAYDKHIIVVSPTTLLATLRTVQTIWRYEHQNRNAEKIAAQAGAIHDQFALVLESMEDLGRQLDKAHESWDRARLRLSAGRGNLVKRVRDLEKLGARTKRKLPSAITGLEELPDQLDDADAGGDEPGDENTEQGD